MEKNKEYCGCITVDVEIKNIKKLRKKAGKLEKELRKAEKLKKKIEKLKLKVFSRIVEQSQQRRKEKATTALKNILKTDLTKQNNKICPKQGIKRLYFIAKKYEVYAYAK